MFREAEAGDAPSCKILIAIPSIAEARPPLSSSRARQLIFYPGISIQRPPRQ
jgi:hypothetical protein